jgi:hypothetical protein
MRYSDVKFASGSMLLHGDPSAASSSNIRATIPDNMNR